MQHKATNDAEAERIRAAGGQVFFGRVMGSLAVSRAFGDQELKKSDEQKNDFVSAEPALRTYKLTKKDKYIVLGCDGLFEKVYLFLFFSLSLFFIFLFFYSFFYSFSFFAVIVDVDMYYY